MKKKTKIDKDDIGYEELIVEEGFFEGTIDGTCIKTFSFSDENNKGGE